MPRRLVPANSSRIEDRCWRTREALERLGPAGQPSDVDWFEVMRECEEWYFEASQRMYAEDYVGLERFEELYEDNEVSVPEFLLDLVQDRAWDETMLDRVVRRLWRLYFMLVAMPETGDPIP